jgi:hypothetical protein
MKSDFECAWERPRVDFILEEKTSRVEFKDI